MFDKLIEKVKAEPKKIVFTEGTDARIQEAAARLLAEGLMSVVLVGNVDEVKAAAEAKGFNIDGAEIVDPETYEGMDEMVEKNLEKAEKKRKSGKKSLVDRVMDKTKDFRNTDTADTGSEEYSESKMYHFANMKTKKLVPPLMEGKEYYGELERRDMSNSGVISKRAYMVSEYDKKNKQTPNGGKK